MSTLLEAEHLTKIFTQRGKESFKAVDDVSFTLKPGETLGIVGESGSGKSSLLKVINGIIPEITEAEISGEIKLNDMRLNEMDIAQRSRYISTVYQNPKTQFYCVESTDELAFPLENRNLPKDEMVKIIKNIRSCSIRKSF